MPGLHIAVLEAGRSAGLNLALGRRVPWLTGRGHLDQLAQASAPTPLLDKLGDMHRELGGDSDALAAKRLGNSPAPDLIDVDSGTLIEVDEVQHFTSARLLTLDHYPADQQLGFDISEYRELIGQWRGKGDRAYAHKTSSDFPQPGGRQAQRAYNDALRDLLAPTFTGHPVIRIPVPGRSLTGALERLESLLDLPSGSV
jgi:hypothetical protein